MTTIRRHPTATAYSIEYQTELMRARAEILMTLRQSTLPLPRLVWQARNAYRSAWEMELVRMSNGVDFCENKTRVQRNTGA